jgi:hypothetical protein
LHFPTREGWDVEMKTATVTKLSNQIPDRKFEIRENSFGRGVYSLTSWKPAELILISTGKLGSQQTAHTIQVDKELHLLAETPLLYLNHSCDPNCGLLVPSGSAEISLHARRKIKAGEELTLDYESFEESIQFLKECACGSPLCRETLRGYKNLPTETREEYGLFVAEYLRTPRKK